MPLGKNKHITGIVYRRHDEPLPPHIHLRNIEEILDNTRIVSEETLQLWEWIADYYMCTLGEVLAAALPAGIIDDNYTARTEVYLSLAPDVDVAAALDSLGRAPRQRQLLLAYLHACRFDEGQPLRPIERRLLIEASGGSPAIVRQLVERKILDETERICPRIPPYTGPIEDPHPLDAEQLRATDEIRATWRKRNVVLLHGVTASGKTEVYIHLIQEHLQRGGSVLYLVPEIALTAQLTERLRLVFGNRLSVFHSRFSDNERVEIYRDLLAADGGRVVIGARSAVFMPLRRLSLVIVDEEHETSYKQQDPAPRYHARSAAIMLAHIAEAKVLLGTATPSLDTWHNAQTGKYGLVQMLKRHAEVRLPDIHLIDLERQYYRKEMYGHFSDPLVARIRQELAQNKQIILFQNRRGYAPAVVCRQCHKPPRCINCDVPLTQHKAANRLVCHYCGYSIPMPNRCPHCGGELRTQGFGTERLEEEVAALFPNARIARMDLDSTRNKGAYRNIINAFSRHEADILIGTQMVTKGLHFNDVSLVAVLNADNLLNQPDFRSYERAFNLLEQVSGRAGRSDGKGEVLLQTFDPGNPVFAWLRAHDYPAMAAAQLDERSMFRYPPFYRLINLTLRHREAAHVEQAARALQQRLQTAFGTRASGVVIPALSRVQNLYIRELRLRIETTAAIAAAKKLLKTQIETLLATAEGKGVRVTIDVDPL